MGKGTRKVQRRMIEEQSKAFGGLLLDDEFYVPVAYDDEDGEQVLITDDAGEQIYMIDKVARNRQKKHLLAYLRGAEFFRYGFETKTINNMDVRVPKIYPVATVWV